MAVILAVLCMIGLDQAVKFWAVTVLKPAVTLPLLQDVFHLTYVENRGAAFSFLAQYNSRWLFAALAVVVSGVMLFALHKKWVQTALGRWALYLVIAGALGNGIDRFIRGFVVDMFDFRLINFAVFNVADIFITVGGVLFVIYILFQHKEKETANE